MLSDIPSKAPFRNLQTLVMYHANAIPIDRRESPPNDVVGMVLRLDAPESLRKLSAKRAIRPGGSLRVHRDPGTFPGGKVSLRSYLAKAHASLM